MADLQDNRPDELPISLPISTHWNLVLVAGRRGTVEPDSALELLCNSYWPPLDAYLHSRVLHLLEAQGLILAYGERLSDRDNLASADPQEAVW